MKREYWHYFSIWYNLEAFIARNVRFQSGCKNFYAWGNSPHNSSNMKDMISLAHCCWNKSKPCFLDITTIFCKQRKNWDGSRAAFLDFRIDIVLTKDDTNEEIVSVCKEKLVHNSTIENEIDKIFLFLRVLTQPNLKFSSNKIRRKPQSHQAWFYICRAVTPSTNLIKKQIHWLTKDRMVFFIFFCYVTPPWFPHKDKWVPEQSQFW